ncbi:uncharacterized protein THITE_2112801 [Thermothielavioides terrestris NRRL 8126]|uniref:Uncharacterized protein n=1 Tax=Thermothielavioides terrestris (strain ATCC 38088 / NRRL 8126) TaxID=578455 RepID=G2R0V0_THETT|nr:uncharacterized protein THITE_2112801 [Thermothielavioides terrestris NRRL 8126]AEO65644.1 hypothetical protein THITE_2112801 [Thermothielavioides terrestris NRRL 8126]
MKPIVTSLLAAAASITLALAQNLSGQPACAVSAFLLIPNPQPLFIPIPAPVPKPVSNP